MAVVKLNKLQLLGYIEDREKILGLLQSLGAVQLEEVVEKTTQEKKIKEEKSEADESDKVKLQPIPLPNLKNLERKLDEVALAINLTSEFMPKESALQKLKKEPQMLSDKEVDKIYQDFESAIAGYGAGKVEAITVITRLKALIDYELLYWKQFTEREKAIARLEALTTVKSQELGVMSQGEKKK